jgi:hypothetical protein
MKKCNKCNQEKEYDGFYKDKAAKDGYNTICKHCRLLHDRIRRIKDPEWVKKRKDHNKQYHLLNSESIYIRKQKWRQTEKGKKYASLSHNSYKKNNREKIRAHGAIYRAVKRGEIVRKLNCEICYDTYRIHAHHANYDKPLEVIKKRRK